MENQALENELNKFTNFALYYDKGRALGWFSLLASSIFGVTDETIKGVGLCCRRPVIYDFMLHKIITQYPQSLLLDETSPGFLLGFVIKFDQEYGSCGSVSVDNSYRRVLKSNETGISHYITLEKRKDTLRIKNSLLLMYYPPPPITMFMYVTREEEEEEAGEEFRKIHYNAYFSRSFENYNWI